MKDVLQGVLIAAAICGAFVFGSRTRAERHLNERTLKPTWFIHGITCLLLALIVLFMPWAWVHARPGEFLAVLGLQTGFGAALVGWIWYFYLRVVYWSNDGVGVRHPVLRPRFVAWQHVNWAGRTWEGSFLISSGKAKVSYTQFDGGHQELNRMIERKLSPSVVHF